MIIVVPLLVGLGGGVGIVAVLWIAVPFLVGYFEERGRSPFDWAGRLMDWAANHGERLACRRNKNDRWANQEDD